MEPKELDRQISSGNIGRLYFFYGPEQFLLENKIKSIKKHIVDSDFEEFNYIKMEGKKVTAREIEGQILSVPVMSDRKLLVVSNCGIFGNAKGKDFAEICEALSDLPEYITLIFTEVEFDKKKEKNLEIFKSKGEIIKFDLLSPKQLELWLEKMFEERGKTILTRELSQMVSLCGQSMATVYTEFNKVLSFVGEREKITAEDIQSVVSKTVDARIFDIIDGIAENKTKNVFEEINALRASGENASMVLTLISTRMSELLLVKQLTAERTPDDKIAGYFEPRKHPFVIKKLTQQSRHFDENYLKKMTLKGINYAYAVRTGRLDKWIAVEMYVSELSAK